MGRNTAGLYELPLSDVSGGTVISATWANTTLHDVELELTNSLSRDGYGGMRGPLRLPVGSRPIPALSFTTDTDSGLYLNADADVRMSVASTDTFKWVPAGVTSLVAFTCSNTLAVTGAVTAAAGVTVTQSTANGAGLTVTANGTGTGATLTGGSPSSGTAGTGAVIAGGAPTTSGTGGIGATVTGGGSTSGAGGTGLVVAGGAPAGGNGNGGTGATITGGAPNGTGTPGVGLTVTGANAASGNTNGAQALTVTGGTATGTGTGGTGGAVTGGSAPNGSGGVGLSVTGGAATGGNNNGGNGLVVSGGAKSGTGAGGNGLVVSSGEASTSTAPRNAIWAVNGNLTFGTTATPAATTAVEKNCLTPGNIVKARALVTTTATTTPTVNGGFCISGAAASGDDLTITFAQPFADTNFTCVVTIGPNAMFAIVNARTTSTVKIWVYSIALGRVVHVATELSGITVDLICIGAQ